MSSHGGGLGRGGGGVPDAIARQYADMYDVHGIIIDCMRERFDKEELRKLGRTIGMRLKEEMPNHSPGWFHHKAYEMIRISTSPIIDGMNVELGLVEEYRD